MTTASKVAVWDGVNQTSWKALGTGTTGGWVSYMLSAFGKIFISGNFAQFNGTTVNYIVQYNGLTFQPLGSGLNQLIGKMISNGTNLIVTGQFSATSTGTPLNQVALWNGVSWSALGSGPTGTVNTGLVMYQNFVTTGMATGTGVQQLDDSQCSIRQ